MRTALISDIHGNFAGLQAVLADIARQNCDRILCLGDLVDGGPHSVEVVRLLSELGIPTVRGNHDEYPLTDLPLDIRLHLQKLPEDIVEGDVLFTHSWPRESNEKIVDAFEAGRAFRESAYRRVFVGDVHVPFIYGERHQVYGEAASYPISYDEAFVFHPDDRYLVCVGAVGYSRDRYPWLRYAIYDGERDTVEFRAPEGPILML